MDKEHKREKDVPFRGWKKKVVSFQVLQTTFISLRLKIKASLQWHFPLLLLPSTTDDNKINRQNARRMCARGSTIESPSSWKRILAIWKKNVLKLLHSIQFSFWKHVNMQTKIFQHLYWRCATEIIITPSLTEWIACLNTNYEVAGSIPLNIF